MQGSPRVVVSAGQLSVRLGGLSKAIDDAGDASPVFDYVDAAAGDAAAHRDEGAGDEHQERFSLAAAPPIIPVHSLPVDEEQPVSGAGAENSGGLMAVPDRPAVIDLVEVADDVLKHGVTRSASTPLAAVAAGPGDAAHDDDADDIVIISHALTAPVTPLLPACLLYTSPSPRD